MFEQHFESLHKCSNINCHFTTLKKSLTPLESNDPGLELNFTVFKRARSFLSTLPSKEPEHEITQTGTMLNYRKIWHSGWGHVSNICTPQYLLQTMYAEE